MSDLQILESCEHNYKTWKSIGDWSVFVCENCGALTTRKELMGKTPPIHIRNQN